MTKEFYSTVVISFLQHWEKLDKGVVGSCPPKSFHTTVCLGYNGPTPKLLVIGGLPFTHQEAWIFDIEELKWNQVRMLYV